MRKTDAEHAEIYRNLTTMLKAGPLSLDEIGYAFGVKPRLAYVWIHKLQEFGEKVVRSGLTKPVRYQIEGSK